MSVYCGFVKKTVIKGKYGGFTKFTINLDYIATVFNGTECQYVSEDNWYYMKKAKLRFDKSRTKHLLEDGDFTMAEAVANVERWLTNKHYTKL